MKIPNDRQPNSIPKWKRISLQIGKFLFFIRLWTFLHLLLNIRNVARPRLPRLIPRSISKLFRDSVVITFIVFLFLLIAYRGNQFDVSPPRYQERQENPESLDISFDSPGISISHIDSTFYENLVKREIEKVNNAADPYPGYERKEMGILYPGKAEKYIPLYQNFKSKGYSFTFQKSHFQLTDQDSSTVLFFKEEISEVSLTQEIISFQLKTDSLDSELQLTLNSIIVLSTSDVATDLERLNDVRRRFYEKDFGTIDLSELDSTLTTVRIIKVEKDIIIPVKGSRSQVFIEKLLQIIHQSDAIKELIANPVIGYHVPSARPAPSNTNVEKFISEQTRQEVEKLVREDELEKALDLLRNKEFSFTLVVQDDKIEEIKTVVFLKRNLNNLKKMRNKGNLDYNAYEICRAKIAKSILDLLD